MQSSWNQPAWGVQASTAYTVPGYPQPIAGTAVAPTATTMSTIPYQVPGYQWPGYAANPTVPAAAVAAAVPGWSQTTAQTPQNPQQQWEQWQQWQQQYAQWQQQYGKDYVAAMQAAGQLPTATAASGVGPIPGAAPLPGAVPGIPAPNVVPTGINSPANIPSVIAHPPPSSAPPPLPTSAPPIDNQSSKRPPDPKENSSDGKKTKAEIEEALQGIQNSLSDMAEAEKQFDEQFNNWERQFNSWREENANHPDTDQYQAYEAKWTSWRNQLLQRREQMKKKKDAKLAELAKLQTEKTALEAASAIPAPSVTPTSYAQTNPSMPYGNFPVQGYNQQMGMYGVGQSAPMFPPVPPPVGPPISLLGDIPSGGPPTAATPMNAPNFMSVPTATSIPTSNPSLPQTPVPQTTGFPVNTNTTQANGSIPSVLPSDNLTGNSHPTNMAGGIPGLDLIDANNKQSGAPYAGLQSLTQPPETLKTPADSKPFDFPQMNKNPRMWPPVGMPPPVGMGGLPPGSMGGPPPMGMTGHSDFNSAPKHFNPPSNLNQPPPGMMAPNEFDFNQLPPKHGPLMGPERPDFSNPPPSFNSVNPPHSNSPFNQSIGEMNDSQRWGSQNEDELSRKPPGGFPNSHERHSGPPFNSRNTNNFGPRPTWQPTGPGSKQALLPTPGLPPPTFDDMRQNNEGMKDGPDSNYVDEPWASREEEPWNNNSAQGRPDSKSGPHRPVQGPPGGPRPLLMPPGSPMTGQRGPPGGPMQSHQGPPKGLSNLPTHGTPNGRFGPPPNDDFMMGPPDKMPPDATLINMDRPPHGMPGFPSGPGDQLRPDVLGVRNNEVKGPPEYFPEVVIDYRHRPADLGIPDMYEPESMIDYAHGANDMDELMKVGALDPPHQKPVSRQPLLPDNRHDHRIHGPWGPPSEWMPPDDPVRPRDRDRRDWDGPRDRDRDRDDRREDRHRDDKRDDRRGRDTDRNRERDRDRSRDRDRRSPGGRWRNDDRKSRDRDRDQRQESRSFDRSRDAKPSPAKDSAPPNRQPDIKPTESHSMPSKLFQINDLLLPPGRNVRPSKIIIILRGPPGSGKSYVAKLLKHKEIEMGGSAPRILSIDDYFMTETDKEEADPETGRKVTKKVMEFEYEAGMESTYQDSLIKAFRKTVADGYFPFIIIDSINSKVSDFEDISGFGRQKGFQVYICDMEMDVNECFKKNVHNRSLKDIAAIIKNWEKPPKDEVILDIRSLLQEASITDVDMEDTVEQTKPEDVTSAENANSSGKDAPPGSEPNEDKTATDASGAKDDSVNTKDGDEETEVDSDFFSAAIRSKWDDLDSGTNKLDRLDGLSKARTSTTIKDWLQLPEDHFESRQLSTESGGKKRVRWADLEERYEQEKMREIGFVVGQTDWGRMMDPTGGQSKLAQTKYI